jgi:hypothetical protein
MRLGGLQVTPQDGGQVAIGHGDRVNSAVHNDLITREVLTLEFHAQNFAVVELQCRPGPHLIIQFGTAKPHRQTRPQKRTPAQRSKDLPASATPAPQTPIKTARAA